MIYTIMKRASILKFKSKGLNIVHAVNTMEGGGGIASHPYFVETDLTYRELAKKLLLALESSQEKISRPKDWQAFRKEHLKTMGFKSMKALHDGSNLVSVSVRDGSYHISPSINQGSRKGFHYIKENITIPEDSSIDELASALEEAFKKSS